MNNFGGHWTQLKIDLLVDYASAYLNVMKDRKYWTLLYFDGFAGSGYIVRDSNDSIDKTLTIGAAIRIIELEHPRPFDKYYFVEKAKKKAELLEKSTKDIYKQKKIYVAQEDCNVKLQTMAKFLRSSAGKNHKVLAYIDPCGMQLNWNSIEALKGLDIDAWILVPTGLGVNRLLTTSGNISPLWMDKLTKFLGLSANEISAYFYTAHEKLTLFGQETITLKEINAIEKSATLYQDRLKTVFQMVTNPFVLKNSSGSVMYHLFMATNNKTALKIGNDVTKKYNKISGNGTI